MPLEATARIPVCLQTNGSGLSFQWANSAVRVAESAPSGLSPSLIQIGATERLTPYLYVAGAWLTSGVIYTMRSTSCLLQSPGVCGYAEVDVALRDEPLVALISGTSRTVSPDQPFVIDACTSGDPDDPTAQCDAVSEGSSCGTLEFTWSCVRSSDDASACDVTVPAITSCAWSMPGLAAGTYIISLMVQKGQTAESDTTSTTVTVPQATASQHT